MLLKLLATAICARKMFMKWSPPCQRSWKRRCRSCTWWRKRSSEPWNDWQSRKRKGTPENLQTLCKSPKV